uniref:Cyclin-I n=1 Tax=Xenopus tropicalis TaxID=8364 RepID=A0A803K0S7_XENTR
MDLMISKCNRETFSFAGEVVQEPTRNDSILDLVISNNNELIANICVGEHLGNSDHNMVSFEIMLQRQLYKGVTKTLNFEHADFASIRASLQCVNWERLFMGLDTEGKWNIFKTLLCRYTQQYIPLVSKERHRKEKPLWLNKGVSVEDVGISPEQRDEVILWLAELKYQFRVYPETHALAISILDRFLAAVKARPKYLRCIAISCFFLAAKTIEEDERIPVLRVLTQGSSCGCSPAEVLRMERIILDKLNWDLHTATPLDFLHIFHAMTLNASPELFDRIPELNPSQHVALLTRQLLQCMAFHQLLQFKGSMLALALLSLEMEKLLPDWLAVTIKLLQLAQMDSAQLFYCREVAAHHLSLLQPPLPPNAVYIYSPLKRTLVSYNRGAYIHPSTVKEPGFHPQGNCISGALIKGASVLYQSLAAPAVCKQASTKRKVEQMEVDDFYDGIKRLYNEDSPQLQAVSVM